MASQMILRPNLCKPHPCLAFAVILVHNISQRKFSRGNAFLLLQCTNFFFFCALMYFLDSYSDTVAALSEVFINWDHRLRRLEQTSGQHMRT
jgi:hypothetical protein